MSEEDEKIGEHDWMIRPCLYYLDEYDECTSIRARFHQYFIFGQSVDCNTWKRDYESCKKIRTEPDEKTKQSIIDHEIARKTERLKAHYENDIWKKRNKPPDDWSKPLPEWLVQREENSYLAQKSKELRGEVPALVTEKYCTIM